MSDSDRPELRAYRELETLVRHLGDELAGFRRRALLAEARLKELEGGAEVTTGADSRERVTELEHENAALRSRLEAATERTKNMLDRVHFLRQQAERDGER
ncbi:MAG: hypothetical protein JWO05_1957 [Gemmatimonadetes bacterium]|nr:hypothetical protein [Gemmatimonadota bacterium]